MTAPTPEQAHGGRGDGDLDIDLRQVSCGDWGPRIGESRPVCYLPKGHKGAHRPHKDCGWPSSLMWANDAAPMTAPSPDPGALLDRLEEARTAATRGPWSVDGTCGPVMGAAILPPYGTSEVPVVALDAGVIREADAALIVALVNAAPTLIRLARERAALRDAVLGLHDGRTCCDRTFESMRGYEPCPTARLVADTTGGGQ